MMRRIGWIGVLSLVCAGMGAARMVAQSGTTHQSGSTSGTAYKRQQPAPGPRVTPAATGTKVAPTNAQKQPTVRPQPTGTPKPLQILPYQSPPASGSAKGSLATVPTQSSGSAPAPNPSNQLRTNWQPTGTRTTGSNSTPTPTRDPAGAVTGSGMTGSNSPPATAQNPKSPGEGSKGSPETGSNSPPPTTKNPPPVTRMNHPPPPRWPPKGSQTPAP
jgi:hypothetical protein